MPVVGIVQSVRKYAGRCNKIAFSWLSALHLRNTDEGIEFCKYTQKTYSYSTASSWYYSIATLSN